MATTKSSAFHPALAISNIKNFIPITLDLENVEYSSWAELFKITARAYQVLDHIIPSKDSADATASTSTSADSTPEGILAQAAAKAEAAALWTRLDAVVLQWIYGTISHDLLHTIIEPDATAQEAWDRLTDIFLDNKHSRAVHLENLFSNTRLENFPNVAAYCRALKTLANQLQNVGSEVSPSRLVLRLVNGLTPQYDTVASLIQQATPLPSFQTARSMILLDETRKAHQLGASSASALLHSSPSQPTPPRPTPPPRGGRGTSSARRGRGGRGTPRPDTPPNAWTSPPPWAYWLPPSPWAVPPCPYPSAPWAVSSSPRPTPGAGILGARPQAHISGPAPPLTDINAAMHTMTLTPPDNNWYMDTGATSHMTSDSGSPHGPTTHEM
ncbi:unnamed protein product [Cuscuta epithymum]|uniref:Uncharacterized protein n=1 Tax=Cuscuta epithymum TaxID=186058 RepID=A0AAV0FCF2_9ASTE|nr:unnamed protein product [Cuscuta epithymum]